MAVYRTLVLYIKQQGSGGAGAQGRDNGKCETDNGKPVKLVADRLSAVGFQFCIGLAVACFVEMTCTSCATRGGNFRSMRAWVPVDTLVS